MERDFKGVWIPKEIWLNQDLGWSEKLLFVEIDSLAKNGECFATNEYFGQFLGVHKKHISRLISNLADIGLVTVELVYKPNSKQIDKRILHVASRNKNVPTPPQKRSYPHHENVPSPIHKNVEDSSFVINTDVNNTNNNTTNKRNIDKKPSSTEIEKEFEQLWKIYPRKMGKKKAFDSYKKARKVKKIPYETIQDGLYRYIRYLEQQETEESYIQHGSTWFNQEKWQDEYITTGVMKKPKNSTEYLKMKYGGEIYEPSRDGEIIEHYSEVVPEFF